MSLSEEIPQEELVVDSEKDSDKKTKVDFKQMWQPFLDDCERTEHEKDDVINELGHCLPSMKEPFDLWTFEEEICQCEQACTPLLAVRKFNLLHSHNILENHNVLRTWVECYEGDIQRRWKKKSLKQRRDILIKVWPYIARTHRMDYAALKKEEASCNLDHDDDDDDSGQDHCNRDQILEPFMWPHLNLQDLANKPDPFLLLLRSRGRNHPNQFIEFDYDSSRVGQCNYGPVRYSNLEKDWREFPLRISFLGATTCVEYGRITLKGPENCDQETGLHTVACRTSATVQTAVIGLQIQQRIYEFLVQMCRSVMHDITLSELATASPAAAPPAYSSSTESMTSLEAAAFEAPYRAPAQMDSSRMVAMLEAKLEAAESHLQSLRDDPSYFANTLLDWKEHGAMRDKAIPGAADLADLDHDDRSDWNNLIRNVIGSALSDIDRWAALLQHSKELKNLESIWSANLCPTSDLPKEYADGFFALIRCLRDSMTRLGGKIWHGFCFSHPMKTWTLRKSLEKLEKGKERSRKSTKRIRNAAAFNKNNKKMEEELDMKVADGFKKILKAKRFDRNQDDLGRWVSEIGHWKQFNHSTVDVILDTIEKSRTTRPAIDDLITSWVSNNMADLSVMAECWRQVMLYQPWSSKFLEDLSIIEKQEKDSGESENFPDEDQCKGECRCHEHKRDALNLPNGELTDALVLKAIPVSRRFYHPNEKKPTKSNIEAMRQAEARLDDFWQDLLVFLREGCLLGERQEFVLSQSVARTQPWIEKCPREIQGTTEEADLDFYFSTLALDHSEDQPRRLASSHQKAKPKTRGTSDSTKTHETTDLVRPEKIQSDPELRNVADSSRRKLQVDARTSKTLSVLFHVPNLKDHRPELLWKEMLYAMTHVGFSAEKLYGSVWQFTLAKDTDSVGIERSIQFHEPHPQKSLSYWKARRLGRRLTRRYGLSWENFEIK